MALTVYQHIKKKEHSASNLIVIKRNVTEQKLQNLKPRNAKPAK